MSLAAPLTDTPGPACASWASSSFVAASEALLENRVGCSPLTFGLRTRLGAGGGDSGEPGGESGVDVWCRPPRLLDELDEAAAAEGTGLEVGLKAGNPPLLLVLPGAVGVWRAMSGVALDEAVGEAWVLVGANSDGGLVVVAPIAWPAAIDEGVLLPNFVPVSMGGGRLSNGGFAPDNGAAVRAEEGGACVPGAVADGLLGVCGEGAWLRTAGWRNSTGGDSRGLGAELAGELAAAGVALVLPLGADRGENGVFFGGPPPPL